MFEASLHASIPGAPGIPGAGQGAPTAPGERRRPARGAEPAPASPTGWSREPEISARTASLSSPKRPGMATQESAGTPALSPKDGFAFPLGGRKVGRRGAVFVTRGEEAS